MTKQEFVDQVASKSGLSRRDAAKVKADIEHVKKWVEHTSRLGGKTMRIFAGHVEKGDDEEKARGRCVESDVQHAREL